LHPSYLQHPPLGRAGGQRDPSRVHGHPRHPGRRVAPLLREAGGQPDRHAAGERRGWKTHHSRPSVLHDPSTQVPRPSGESSASRPRARRRSLRTEKRSNCRSITFRSRSVWVLRASKRSVMLMPPRFTAASVDSSTLLEVGTASSWSVLSVVSKEPLRFSRALISARPRSRSARAVSSSSKARLSARAASYWPLSKIGSGTATPSCRVFGWSPERVRLSWVYPTVRLGSG